LRHSPRSRCNGALVSDFGASTPHTRRSCACMWISRCVCILVLSRVLASPIYRLLLPSRLFLPRHRPILFLAQCLPLSTCPAAPPFFLGPRFSRAFSQSIPIFSPAAAVRVMDSSTRLDLVHPRAYAPPPAYRSTVPLATATRASTSHCIPPGTPVPRPAAPSPSVVSLKTSRRRRAHCGLKCGASRRGHHARAVTMRAEGRCFVESTRRRRIVVLILQDQAMP
jgi:hypothetical protein